MTKENIPYLLGKLVAKLDQISKDQDEIKKVLAEHGECLEIFKFSKCKLVPWLGRNRYVIGIIFGAASLWLSSLDWLNRWLQWTFLPPQGP